jgi:DNA ligase (NAD+)
MAYCSNSRCPAQRLESLKQVVSRGAMDIRGLGPQTLEKMLELKLIEDTADLYNLTAEQVARLPGFKEKSIGNLLASLEQSKLQPFDRVLFALGIRHVGQSIAELLASEFGSIDELQNATEERINDIQGIGPEIARSVGNYFTVEGNLKLIRKLRDAGLQFSGARKAAPAGPFAGKTFVITGTLPTMSRKQAEEFIQDHGGKVTSAVSAKTSYLLVGADAGSKLQKAEKLGVERITEDRLKQLAES